MIIHIIHKFILIMWLTMYRYKIIITNINYIITRRVKYMITNNLYQARDTGATQRYNIYTMLNTAIQNKNIMRLDTTSKKTWFNGLHPTTKQLIISTCKMHGIKIINWFSRRINKWLKKFVIELRILLRAY
jgi:hypothetical protein